MDAGLLMGRVVLGTLMAAHGAQKLFGWFGGYGIAGTGAFFEQLGFRPGRQFAAAAGASELAGGLLLALGLFGPIGPALVLSVMIVAIVTVHARNGLLSSSNGIELPLLYATGAIALAFTGFGRYSLDALFGLSAVWTPGIAELVVLLGIIGGLANVAIRRVPMAA